MTLHVLGTLDLVGVVVVPPMLALVASVALPRCSSTDKREKRHRCLEGVERGRWEDRVENVRRVQTWVRLHGLTRRHMGSRWPTPRSKKHFKALRRAAKVDVKEKETKEAPIPIWRDIVAACSCSSGATTRRHPG